MTPAKRPPKTTWRDWLAEDGLDQAAIDAIPLVTRDDLIARVNDLLAPHIAAGTAAPIDRDDLETWEYRGFLPRPIRRRHNAATRVLYPALAAEIVYRFRSRQQRGWSLAECAAAARAEDRSRHSTDPLDQEIRAHADPTLDRPVDQPSDVTILPAELVAGARRLASWDARLVGSNVARIELTVRLANGRRVTRRIPRQDEENNGAAVATDGWERHPE